MPRGLAVLSHVIRITSRQPNFAFNIVQNLNSETLHERYWEVSRLLCSVVGCGTDWQQETRSSVFLTPAKEFAIQASRRCPACRSGVGLL
jgi:hypothetical protein